MVVPKKLARLSVSRHRIKRQVLAALRALSPLPPSLIIFPKSSALRLDYGHLKADLSELIHQISLNGRRDLQ